MSVDPGRYPYPPQQPSPWVQQPAPQPYAYAPPPVQVHRPVPGGPGFVNSGGDSSGAAIALAAIGVFLLIGMMAAIAIPSFLNQRAKQQQASDRGTEIPVDGRSSLPGDHAQLSFEPLPTQSEWVLESNVDAPYDGSQWWVACSCSEDFMLLQYYAFKPPMDSEAAIADAVAQETRHATLDSRAAVKAKPIAVGDSTGYRFRYTNRQGREVLRVMVFGPVHSYRFECNVETTDSPKYEQCKQALASMRVDA